MTTMTLSAPVLTRRSAPITTQFPTTATSVRLTRRGRLLLLLLTLVLAVAASVVLAGGLPASAGTDTGEAVSAAGRAGQRVTVRPGDTLWAIAERVAPGTDPRETVARILELNGLTTSQVRAGTALLLP